MFLLWCNEKMIVSFRPSAASGGDNEVYLEEISFHSRYVKSSGNFQIRTPVWSVAPEKVNNWRKIN